MRRAIRPLPPVLDAETPRAQRLDCGRRERFGLGHRRQDARKPRGEHRLAGTRRPDHDHAVRARRRDLQRALRVRLRPHVRHVGVLDRDIRRRLDIAHQRLARGEVRADLEQRARGIDDRILHERRFSRVLRRDHESAA
jgi:hypothetical protein